MISILGDSYESSLTDEKHEALVAIGKHAIAPPLSPAAQAVLDAAVGVYEPNVCYEHKISIAAALRAAADQMSSHHSKAYLYNLADGLKLKAIADEFEAQ
jgi:hypothetical protein